MIEAIRLSAGKTNTKNTLAAFDLLEIDDIWTPVVRSQIREGIPDIRAILYYLAKRLKPANYIEIGVRRGFSLAMVAAAAPKCNLYGFDAWVPMYARSPNPGPEFVETEITKFERSGKTTLISGKSSETLPQFLADNPGFEADLVLIDGGHNYEATAADIGNAMRCLAKGGYLIVDDLHGDEIKRAWDEMQTEYPALEYDECETIGIICNG